MKCSIESDKVGLCLSCDEAKYKKVNYTLFPNFYDCFEEKQLEKKFYYDPTDNSCLEQCPIGFKFLVENTYKCLSECPENYPYYLKDANYATNNHLICKRFHPCSGDNYLILDGQCASPQNCETAGKNKINSKRSPLSLIINSFFLGSSNDKFI